MQPISSKKDHISLMCRAGSRRVKLESLEKILQDILIGGPVLAG
jgi:hypothetical protein